MSAKPLPRTARGGLRILLIVGSWALVGLVGFVWYRTTLGSGDGPPQPLPVAEGDTEVVWLFPATSTGGWRELVKALGEARDVLHKQAPPGSSLFVERAAAFPQETTAVPEVALNLSAGGTQRRLVFRWYKLTSNWDTCDWATALVARGRPPPFAFIGGSNTNQGRELACALRAATDEADLPEADRPWLLLTEATADVVGPCPAPCPENPAGTEQAPAGERIKLNEIYRGRTRRFCFTNRQMAETVARFLWDQPDLRPNREPIVAASWNDDSYSRDLVEGFADAVRDRVGREMLRERGRQAGALVSLAATPPWAGLFPLQRAADHGQRWREPNIITLPIDSSVGEFLLPNQFEERAVQALLAEAASDATPLTGLPAPGEGPPRQLLVVGGQIRPTRRFLRTLVASAPLLARRLVVASGDVLSFNTVYRDRRVQWPIQELPFPLVFFCHFNPVDPTAGFHPLPERSRWNEPERPAPRDPWTVARVTTGTEEILLYREVVRTLVREWLGGPGGLDGADRSPLFDDDGNRRPGTGEYVVCVRPRFQGHTPARVLPEAVIEVWPAKTEGQPGECLERLPVHYGEVISPMAVERNP